MIKVSLLTKTIFAGCVLTVLTASSVYASNLAKVTATSVNIRSYNSTEGRVVGTADTGDVLTITGDAHNGWFKIKKPGLEQGFIGSQFISIYQTDATCIADNVNVRTSPSPSGAILGTAKKGQVFVTSGKNGDWYQISFNGNTGYINSEYMQGSLLKYLPSVQSPTASDEVTAEAIANNIADNIYAVVTADSLNLRESPSTDSKVLCSFYNGYNLSVAGYKDGWVIVSDDNGNTGYVKADYIQLKNGSKPKNASFEVNDADTYKFEQGYVNSGDVDCREVVSYAENFIGTPYVWGGTDLTSGVDCSGFVYSVYKNFGITLNRTSRDMYTQGKIVGRNELVPGDLLFFNTGGDSVISHVGMYIGEGKYIHSTNGAGNGVTISNLDDDYSTSTYVGARRILE